MSYWKGAIKDVEYCPHCGGFAWGCLDCGKPAGVSEIVRAGKSAEYLFRKSRILTDRDLSALVRVCVLSGPPYGTRDVAIIAVLYWGRLKATEIAGIGLEDWDRKSRTLSVAGRESRSTRNVTISVAAANAVERWILVRGLQAGKLFVDLHGYGEQDRGSGIGANAVRAVVEKRAEQAGIGYITVADLNSASLRPLAKALVPRISTAKASSSNRDFVAGTTESHPLGDELHKPRPIHNLQEAELIWAAKKLSSLRPVDTSGPGPLNELTDKDLRRLRKRVTAVLLRREVITLEGGQELWGRLPSYSTRSRIAAAISDGIPKQEISRLVGVSRKTIDFCLKEARRNGVSDGFKVEESYHDGTRKIGETEKRVILEDLKARPDASLTERNAHLAEVTNVDVSYQTVLYHIRKMGFEYRDRRWMRAEDTNNSGG